MKGRGSTDGRLALLHQALRSYDARFEIRGGRLRQISRTSASILFGDRFGSCTAAQPTRRERLLVTESSQFRTDPSVVAGGVDACHPVGIPKVQPDGFVRLARGDRFRHAACGCGSGGAHGQRRRTAGDAGGHLEAAIADIDRADAHRWSFLSTVKARPASTARACEGARFTNGSQTVHKRYSAPGRERRPTAPGSQTVHKRYSGTSCGRQAAGSTLSTGACRGVISRMGRVREVEVGGCAPRRVI